MITRKDLDGKAITLNGTPHKITFEKNLHGGSMGGDLMGEIDHAALTIKIDEETPDAMLLVVLLHECYHSMVEQTGTKFMEVRGHDEAFASRVSYFYAQVMYDNPWLLTAITARGKFEYAVSQDIH